MAEGAAWSLAGILLTKQGSKQGGAVIATQPCRGSGASAGLSPLKPKPCPGQGSAPATQRELIPQPAEPGWQPHRKPVQAHQNTSFPFLLPPFLLPSCWKSHPCQRTALPKLWQCRDNSTEQFPHPRDLGNRNRDYPTALGSKWLLSSPLALQLLLPGQGFSIAVRTANVF